eukprot:SAG22_NODE_5372_length_1026_cov_1.148867_1_plen_294_part_01
MLTAEVHTQAGAGAAGSGGEPFVLSESSTICEWLDERVPYPPLLPSVAQAGRRAKLRFALRFHDLYVDPQVKQLFKHVDPRTRDETALATIAAALRTRLEQLEALHVETVAQVPAAADHGAGRASGGGGGGGGVGGGGGGGGQPFLDGHAFSLVDCCLPPTLLLMERLAATLLGRSLLRGGGCDRLWRWLELVVAHPTMSPVVAEASAATDAWLERKLRGEDTAFEEGWWNVGRADHSGHAGGGGGGDGGGGKRRTAGSGSGSGSDDSGSGGDGSDTSTHTQVHSFPPYYLKPN